MSSDLPIIIFTLLATIVPWLMLAFFGLGPGRVADDREPGRITEGASDPLTRTSADGREVSSTSVAGAAATFASATDSGDIGVTRPAHAG